MTTGAVRAGVRVAVRVAVAPGAVAVGAVAVGVAIVAVAAAAVGVVVAAATAVVRHRALLARWASQLLGDLAGHQLGVTCIKVARMRSVADVQAQVIAAMRGAPRERVALDAAAGRVLAAPVVASRSLPGYAASAMDGFAVRAADVPGRLRVVGTVAAGVLDPAAMAPGTAVRIMTGAMMPAGADTVVIFEDAREGGDGYVELPAARAGEHVRRPGEDVGEGATVIAPGGRIGAGEIALCAALGAAELEVAARPRVAIIATGDELVDLATVPRAGQVVDSSAHMLAVQIGEAGGAPSYLGIARDDRAALARQIAAALGHDAVVTTGGVSAGDLDHVLAALGDAGVALDLWKVAMKPGKPFAFGRARDGGTPVFALPGNPVSSWVAFELFVRPALLAMQGAARVHRPRAPVELPGGYEKPAGRAHYLRASIARDGARLVATPFAKQGSAMLGSLVRVDGLVEVPAETTAIAAGGVADALLLEAV
jgi:molybdopterin molybdotransferase